MEQKREFEAWREVVRAIVPGGDVDVYRMFGGYDYLDLSLVRVPLADRENGLANRVMQAIHDYADERGLPVYLTAEKLGEIGPSSTRLAKWYRGLGYVPNRGRNKDFRGPLQGMVRFPLKRLRQTEVVGNHHSYRCDECHKLVLQLCHEAGATGDDEDLIEGALANHDPHDVHDAAHGDLGALMRLRRAFGLSIFT